LIAAMTEKACSLVYRLEEKYLDDDDAHMDQGLVLTNFADLAWNSIRWDCVVSVLKHIPRLRTLNLSFNPLDGEIVTLMICFSPRRERALRKSHTCDRGSMGFIGAVKILPNHIPLH
uniref:Nuclear RNA export factor 1 n=1 Tax=Heligmosomoides polygyrus TaxID=6339 RepID=A0A183GW32_HELPZ